MYIRLNELPPPLKKSFCNAYEFSNKKSVIENKDKN